MNNVFDVTPESAGAYIKRGLESEFAELFKKSKDKNFYIAHVCMLYLAGHYLRGEDDLKMTPKQAYEKAIENYLNLNKTMIKTLVTQFSIRGEEFGDWVESPEKWETLWELEK